MADVLISLTGIHCKTHRHITLTYQIFYEFASNNIICRFVFFLKIFGQRFDGFQRENLREKYKNTTDPKILEILRKNNIRL